MSSGNTSQPWKAFWPPTPANVFVNPNLNVVCSSKGALPHDAKFADGTNVMRLDSIQNFLVDVAEKVLNRLILDDWMLDSHRTLQDAHSLWVLTEHGVNVFRGPERVL